MERKLTLLLLSALLGVGAFFFARSMSGSHGGVPEPLAKFSAASEGSELMAPRPHQPLAATDQEPSAAPAVEPEAEAPPATPVAQTREEEEESFKWLYETMDEQGLMQEALALHHQLDELTQAAFEERFAAKEYVRLPAAANGGFRLSDLDPRRVQAMRPGDKGDYLQATLPEDKYPEAYAVNRKAQWINDLLVKRRKESR